MKHIFVDPPPKFVSRSHAVLRRGRSGYEITSLSSSHSLSQLLIYTFSCLKPLVLSRICSGWELICFHSRLQQFPEEFGVDEQNYVVVSVIVSDSHHILHLPSPPSKY